MRIGTNLGKRSTISLRDDGKLPAIIRRPAPRGRTLASLTTQGRVREEVMQIDIVATEEEVRLVPEGNRLAIPTLSEVQLWVLFFLNIGGAKRGVLVPLPELLRHDALVHDAGIVQLGGADLILGDLLAGDQGREGGEGELVLHDVSKRPDSCNERARGETNKQRGRNNQTGDSAWVLFCPLLRYRNVTLRLTRPRSKPVI